MVGQVRLGIRDEIRLWIARRWHQMRLDNDGLGLLLRCRLRLGTVVQSDDLPLGGSRIARRAAGPSLLPSQSISSS